MSGSGKSLIDKCPQSKTLLCPSLPVINQLLQKNSGPSCEWVSTVVPGKKSLAVARMWNVSICVCCANICPFFFTHNAGISCGVPPPLENGGYAAEDFFAGSTITYQCNSGYYLLGDFEMFCRDNGSWSSISPSCLGETCHTYGCMDWPSCTSVLLGLGAISFWNCES